MDIWLVALSSFKASHIESIRTRACSMCDAEVRACSMCDAEVHTFHLCDAEVRTCSICVC